ncbi:MAG: hypothetical protein Q4G07_02185 [Oscillospiraceae bacterium]|nr:hypothetical protein [Oscillospiraceae bacterium]
MAENEILINSASLENKKATIDTLIQTMEEYAEEVKNATFGAGGTCCSTGPCCNALCGMNQAILDTILKMASTMKELKDYVTNGAQEMKQADEFFAAAQIDLRLKQ